MQNQRDTGADHGRTDGRTDGHAAADDGDANKCLPRDAGHDAPERPRERHGDR